MINIGISVKDATWRANDVNARHADIVFRDVKTTLLAKKIDENGHLHCEGCSSVTRAAPASLGSKPDGRTEQGYFEFHHISGDHSDNRPENLGVLCPYCHAPFHIGFNCASENGCLIFAPEIAQVDISRITLLSAVYANVSDNPHVTAIKQTYSRLAARRVLVDDLLGLDSGVMIAEQVLRILRDPRPIGEQRRALLPRLLAPIRYLPYVENSRMNKAVAYWRQTFRGVLPQAREVDAWVDIVRGKIEEIIPPPFFDDSAQAEPIL